MKYAVTKQRPVSWLALVLSDAFPVLTGGTVSVCQAYSGGYRAGIYRLPEHLCSDLITLALHIITIQPNAEMSNVTEHFKIKNRFAVHEKKALHRG